MNRKLIWLEFTFLALLIMGPLLLPGYVQTLDMTWGPHLSVPSWHDNTWLFYTVIKAFSVIITSQITEKLLLLGIFIMAGVGAYRLTAEHPAMGRAGSYAAGIFYLFNPFVYTRFIEGQYLVLAGYALLPWAVAAIWRLVTAPSWRHAWRAAGWGIAVACVSLHTVGFVALIGVVMAAVGFRHSRRLWTWLGISAGLVVALGAIVLGPLILGGSSSAQAIKTFNSSQYTAFATTSDVASVPVSALLLEGFWNDHSHTFTLPSSLGTWWLGVAIILGTVMVVGGIRVYQRNDRLGYVLLICAVTAWWLAMGVGWGPSAPVTNWLVAHVPFYRGYREPGKWLAVVALAYAYVLARGVSQLQLWLSRRDWLAQAAVAVALVLPVALTPTMLWAAGGQLRSANYPPDWYAVNKVFNAAPGSFQVLILPWHQYLPVSFVGRPVANPAGVFFDRPVIVSDNPELTGVTADREDGAQAPVENWLTGRDTIVNTLPPLGIRYIVLMKEADWQSYTAVLTDPNLTVISDTATLRVYRLNAVAP